MKLLHEQSSQCLRSELDLFSLPPTQTAVDGSQWVEHSPCQPSPRLLRLNLSCLAVAKIIMDLNNTLLEVKACIKTTNNSPVDAAVAVAPINNTLHSLCSQIDVSLNDVNVSSATTTYPYRAYIETHLNYGTDAKKSRLQAAMYFIDDNLTVSNPIPDSSSARNMGLKRRHGICTAKPTFDMIGPLHVDVFNQSKYMLNGVTMKVRMTRSKDSFVLMAKSDVTESFKVDILSAKLFVRKLKITPSLCLAHERILQQKTAKYPITRVECKVIHLPQGQKSFTHDNLFLGQLPKIIVLGLVDNRAFNGDISLNPYNFQHCNLNYLAVHLDGQQVPWAPLQPSLSGSSYIRAFYTQFTGGDGISSDTGSTIGRDQFVNGHALYCFDLTPDLSSSCGHHFSVTKSGNLRLELAFEVALSITGNVLVYREFDNVIEIDKDRKVTRNYGH